MKSNCEPIFLAELPVFHTGLIPKDVHRSSVQGINWYQSTVYSSNCSKAQPDPEQPVGRSWKDPSLLRARIRVRNWEGGGSRKEQDPVSWGMPEGRLLSRAAVAGQNNQGRSPSPEFRTRHRGAQKALTGATCAGWTRVLSLPAAAVPSPLGAPAPAAVAVTSAGCSLCSQSHRIRN